MTVLLAFLVLCQAGLPCGPFFEVTYFVHVKHPDVPFERFASGDLGVLQPTYARSYLVVAYRFLSGEPLTPREQQDAVRLWNDRLKRDYDWHPKDPADHWLAVRAQVTGSDNARKPSAFRSWGYVTLLNCPSDAFVNAASVLGEKIKKLGAKNPEVIEWTKAQDEVFSNCDHKTPPSIPSVGTGGSPWFAADRKYQVAAAHLYSGLYDSAVADFSEIEKDSTSPWSGRAPYLIARTLTRKSVTEPAEGGDELIDRATLQQAEEKIEAILRDPKLGAIHPATRRLRAYVMFRLNPEGRQTELARLLRSKSLHEGFYQDLWDYTWLLDRLIGDDYDEDPVVEANKKAEKYRALAGARQRDPLFDWIMTFQSDSDHARAHAMKSWLGNRKSIPWLLAAISKATGAEPEVESLIEAASQIPAESPAYLSANFDRVRLLTVLKRYDEARAVLSPLLQRSWPPHSSAQNAFLQEASAIATDFQQFLKFAPRLPVLVTGDEDGLEVPPVVYDKNWKVTGREPLPSSLRLDHDTVLTFNRRLPLSSWVLAAEDATLPLDLRTSIALAAWTRAVLIEDEETAARLAALSAELAPEMRAWMDQYSDTSAGEPRKNLALYILLKNPGLRPYLNAEVRKARLGSIDDFRDNWWCADLGTDIENGTYVKSWTESKHPKEHSISEVPIPLFLSREENSAAAQEWKALDAVQSAPNYFLEGAYSYATQHVKDARAPELLVLAMRARRYGCGGYDGSDKLEKKVFRYLAKTYPGSKWEKKSRSYN